MRYQVPEERKFPERQTPPPRIQYVQERVIGTEIRDYSTLEARQKMKDELKKTSDVLKSVNELFSEGSDALTKIQNIDDIIDVQKLAATILNSIAQNVRNGNFEAAERIYKEEFMRLKHCDIKGAFSVGELKNNRDKQNKFLRFCDKFQRFIKPVEKIKDYADKVEKAFKYLVFIRAKVSAGSDYKRELSEAEKISREFESAKENMNILMDACNDLCTFAPPGFREYIEYNVTAFKAADQAMKIISRHTGKLAEAADQAEKEWQKTIGTTKINAYSGREALMIGDIDKYLDIKRK